MKDKSSKKNDASEFIGSRVPKKSEVDDFKEIKRDNLIDTVKTRPENFSYANERKSFVMGGLLQKLDRFKFARRAHRRARKSNEVLKHKTNRLFDDTRLSAPGTPLFPSSTKEELRQHDNLTQKDSLLLSNRAAAFEKIGENFKKRSLK